MSLTKLFGPTGPKEIRSELSCRFKKPRFKIDKTLLSPPFSKNYPGVGSAFDYLIRFYLERKNRTRLVYKSQWVAESAINIIIQHTQLYNDDINFFKGNIYPFDKFKVLVRKEFTILKEAYVKYQYTGIISNELFEASLFMGQLDLFVRTNYRNEQLGIYNPNDIRDLKNLFYSIPESDFEMKYILFLNPTFGKGSELVNGADADIIIDDLLIDIKVTKNHLFKRDYFNQLIGYYTLSLIGGVNDKPNRTNKIKRLGVYFARHSKLISFNINDIGRPDDFEDFKNWLIKFLKKQVH